MGKERLGELVEARLTVRQIAKELGVTPLTVSRWLREAGLSTARARERAAAREARSSGTAETELECPVHGLTLHRQRPRGSYACLRCRSESVVRRRRKVKAILVEEAGGRCERCGYDRHVAALHFHHRDPKTKRFALAAAGVARSLERARAEARKCALLCANCHAEVEAGMSPDALR